ncbi:TraB/GumN family protein [Stenotrophomonas maltophilia]|uniref:TraB/GumN family protein n=1 Tax=Stenotrophomonas maltophilia TaxID=40324 RepID=UPI0013133BF1|nr:TraB/GumN family protein [Stenotrophomonas maltophilia]MBA0284678.1 TraB/GumN family protein [Stenotrophomonas maltophilia]MBA0322787.1 TraB/GumN family protein [Stenotrophomonas maltophilia]
MLKQKSRLVLLIALALPAAGINFAAAADATEPPLRTLDTVVVSGVAPGPGLWRVSRGEHTLWILGTLKPVPSSITWDSAAVREVIAEAQAVLWEPSFTVDVDTGWLGKLSLGYSYMKAQNNPGNAQLKDILAPDVYARWQNLRDTYLAGRSNLEGKRPLAAADELMSAVMAQRGLSSKGVVAPVIVAEVKARGIGLHTPRYTLKLSRQNAAQMLKAVRSTSIDDSACLVATMDLVESGMDRLVTNANAWSTGETARIDVSLTSKRDELCTDSLSNAPAARAFGMPDIRTVVREKWLAAADKALQTNTTTLAVLPIADLSGNDGYIDALRQRGYEVESP